MEIIIGLGDYAVSANHGDIIKTFSLASCVAVTMYSHAKGILGMAHIVLPDSSINRSYSRIKPTYYANTGILFLLDSLGKKWHCQKKELEVSIFGGADSTYSQDVFQTGRKNIEMVKYTLAANRIAVRFEDTGGHLGRHISADVGTGIVKVKKFEIKNI